ncbi:MAG: hypothetical protein AB8B60_08340 [Sulfitobacter sp.]
MDDLPLPRLELRWRDPTKDEIANTDFGLGHTCEYACDYGIVLPLKKKDRRSAVRNENRQLVAGVKREVFYVFETTHMSGGSEPLAGQAPMTEDDKAIRDSKALGKLPIYVRARNGETAPLKR